CRRCPRHRPRNPKPRPPRTGGPPSATTEPPARPETAVTPPVIAPPPQTPAVALDIPPQAEPAMPVPPPGIATAPDLPPDLPPAAPAPAAGPGGEITLMPDGALVPPGPARPRVIVPGQGGPGEGGAGFASAEGTKVNRLPQVGSAPQGSSVPPSGAPVPPFVTDPAPQPAPEATGPALTRFGAAFVEKPGKPYVTVLLVDVGTTAGGLDAQTIAALGSWVTVVLDPAAPGVTEAAATYRAAGLEVAMLAGALPAGAQAQDLEVALAAWQRAVPQAVALVEPETPVLQGKAPLLAQAEKALAAEGMAYVTQPGGIGARATKDVPRAGIFRVLDARRDKAAVITRTLGRAGFEAARDGATVVMLSAWPESVAGLTAWAAEEGANYNLAPLSALIGAGKTK
ncbi:divergent polysaccharide deacetylase family protein, partial [Rhodobacter capsulatus]|uniref:divergent polysaccharide deacetylase family protein n=1 Tax=Rhodobacter capsulatus TaxID=1061 RepID=UPI000A62A4BE